MASAIVIPSCDDSNRGDQALVWQTREVANLSGLGPDISMLSASGDTRQTLREGIPSIAPILRHPQAAFAPRSNLKYTPALVAIWGMIAVRDVAWSSLLLTPPGRRILGPLLPKSAKQTLRAIERADALFVKGGGFIHSTGSISDAYRAYYTLYHVLLAHSLKKPVYVMPNSYGPFEGRLFRNIVKSALSRCKIVTARETISQNQLRELGIDAELFPDLAFGLAKRDSGAAAIGKLRAEHEPKKIVAITARPYRFPGAADSDAAYRRYIAEMAKLAEMLDAQGYRPVFVEHVQSDGMHESDRRAIEDIMALLPSDICDLVSDSSYDCRDLKAIYANCDFVVGTRFHSVIFALSEGVPALAIAYGGNKGTGIMNDLGLPEDVVDISEFDAKFAMSRVRAHLDAEVKADPHRYADLAVDRISSLVARIASCHSNAKLRLAR